MSVDIGGGAITVAASRSKVQAVDGIEGIVAEEGEMSCQAEGEIEKDMVLGGAS